MFRFEKNGERHEVHWSAMMAKTVRRLQRQAAEEGRGDEFLAALRQIHRRLRRDPNSFGDPLYRLPAMRLRVRCGIVSPILVYFAVSDDEMLVYIKGVVLLPKPTF